MKRDRENSTIIKEFSRFAHSYDSHNTIQKEVAAELVSSLPDKRYKQIIDIGCGSGAIYQNLVKNNHIFEAFFALDSSDDMLRRHPFDDKIKKYCIDFDQKNAFNTIKSKANTLLISSSALQWSRDLDRLYKKLSKLSKDIHFAIFTSNTFKTLHQVARIKSPIESASVIEETILKYYEAKVECKTYRLYFNTTREMFQYIKKSGVSGGKKTLSYQETKALIDNYPLAYLEFEVLFVSSIAV